MEVDGLGVTSLLGVDVSHWQATTPSLIGLSFVFAKATEGKSIADAAYPMHSANVLKAGLHLGAYHFIRQGDPIDDQARWFIAHAANAAALAVDNEGAHAMTRQGVAALITAIRKADPQHRKVGLYMSESPYITGGFRAAGADFAWIANWAHTPSVAWDIHQYSGAGLDRDRAYSQAALDAIFRPAPVVTPAPHFAATVTTPTNLWNDKYHRWVYNGTNRVKVGTRLVIRGAQYAKDGVKCYPIVGPLYAGYYVPVAHVKVGAKLP